jgi:hypothetical protein
VLVNTTESNETIKARWLDGYDIVEDGITILGMESKMDKEALKMNISVLYME